MLTRICFKFYITFLFYGIFFPVQSVLAQGPPIITDSPLLIGLNGGSVRTFGQYTAKENVDVFVFPVMVPYNFNSKFQIGGVLPFVQVDLADGPSNSGVGDAQFFVKHELFQKNGKGKTFRITAKVVQTFPTGKTSGMPALSPDAWQTELDLLSGYVTTQYGVYLETGYKASGNNLSNSFIHNLALVIPLLPPKYPPNQLNVSLELNGRFDIDAKQNNLFITPGIQWLVNQRLLFESAVQLPLTESVSKTQETEFSILLGTRLLIF
ncbi:MAG: hypothetical protein U1C58_13210 [Flavobacteriaceae bacterium]|nr:hypothetical protein [Flavobacteriaceae bacterium]